MSRRPLQGGGVLSPGHRRTVRAVFFVLVFAAMLAVPLALPSSGDDAANLASAGEETSAPTVPPTSAVPATTPTTAEPVAQPPLKTAAVVRPTSATTLKKTTTTTKPTTTTVKATTTTASSGNVLTGQASWYAAGAGTCAMIKPAMGTIVHVTNLATGASTTCRVADRGPYVTGRVIDLDKGVFALIGNPSAGIISVRVTW